ncbi:MAG: YbfB/YjiJ family MFS transporter [Ilumatobacteraceae bacterium]
MTAGGPDTHDTHHVDAGPALRRDLALATWGLFVGLALLLLAGGLFGTLLGVRAETEGLATGITGLIAAAYYLGFVVGSRLTLSSLGRVGHIRVYAALAALLTAAMLGVGLTGHWAPWALLRLVTGLCFAGQYVVAESWLNDLATNANRGRLLAIYNVVTIAAFAVGQAVVFAFDAVLVTGFAVCAIAASLAVVPVTLSEEAVAPKVEEAEHISAARVVRGRADRCGFVLPRRDRARRRRWPPGRVRSHVSGCRPAGWGCSPPRRASAA